MHSIDLLEQWLVEVDTNPNLRECLVEYAKGQGFYGRDMQRHGQQVPEGG